MHHIKELEKNKVLQHNLFSEEEMILIKEIVNDLI